MEYRLKIGEAAETGIRRIISGQIDHALKELADSRLSQEEKVHRFRRQCKKIRAALRLVQGGLGRRFSSEDKKWRKMARRISDARDAEAAVETCDTLAQHFSDQVDRNALRSIRKELLVRKKAVVAGSHHVDSLMHHLESAMRAEQKQVASLAIRGDGSRVLLAGMRKTYSLARQAMQNAYNNPVPAAFHEWRKQAKYHAFHMRLLHELWPAMMQVREEEAVKLERALGRHHNLCVLSEMILDDPASFAGTKQVAIFIGLVDQWLEQIQNETRLPGARLFTETPESLGRRFDSFFSEFTVNAK